jgi:VCBS repeat-containing protein
VDRRIVALGLLALASVSAFAETLGVRGTASLLEIYGAETGTVYANGAPGPCCFIATGASARDAANNRQWIGAVDDGTDVLYRFDQNGDRASLALPEGHRVEALAFFALRGELVALLHDRSLDRRVVQRYAAESGAVVSTAEVAESTGAQLRAGVSTWSASRRAFLVIGRRSVDAAVGLLSIGTNGQVQYFASPDADATQALAIDPSSGNIFALRHLASTKTTVLHQITLGGANAAFVAIGGGESDCCFVLAGTAAVDGGQFRAFAYPIGSVTPTLYRFDLATGLASPLPTTAPSAGLHVDAALPITAFLFRDGFE